MIDIHTSANANAEKGVSGEGLMTAVQPAASAAPNLRVIIAEGKFQGVKIDLYAKKSVEHYADIGRPYTTPTGCLIVIFRILGDGDGITSVQPQQLFESG